jgi:apolipoprotein D and lipocalin family protein
MKNASTVNRISFRYYAAGVIAGLALAAVAGCASDGADKPPIPTVAKVDLDRYMGPWFVVGAIPIGVEKEAYDALETYTLSPDGSVATIYRFHDEAFDGKLKTYNSTGFVQPGTGNAIWGIQFIWPFKSEYRIAYLADDYSLAIVARNKRDYVWVLSRKPILSDAVYDDMKARIAAMGYDLSRFRRFPQNGEKP